MDKKAVIGKNVIESLTFGMYEDARTVYREYIQNSADQIDIAVEKGQLESINKGQIEININQNQKVITFTDNATGIESSKVPIILKNIAQSTKDRTKNKGFRGIGRLGGLAYCSKLIFETSFKGENIKSVLEWNAEKLRSIIDNYDLKEEAVEVIERVTSFNVQEYSKDDSYFKVTMEGVTNESLLDKQNIYDYLSMIAPLKYAKGFAYKTKIYEAAKAKSIQIDEYNIFLNNQEITKEYRMSIYEGDLNKKKKYDEISDIVSFQIDDNNGEILAWGWYGISNFTKKIPSVNTARGLRLRKGNIQIGSDNCLAKLFKEHRGAYYYFGEIHAVHSDLIPNARRDYFLDNDSLRQFESKLRIEFGKLYKLYHFSSQVRSQQKKIDEFIAFSEEFVDKKVKSGFTNHEERKVYQEKFEKKREEADIAKGKLNKMEKKIEEQDIAQNKIFNNLVLKKEKDVEEAKTAAIVNPKKTKFITDDLARLSRKDKKLVSRIFAVIDNVLPNDLSNILKEKIKEELQ